MLTPYAFHFIKGQLEKRHIVTTIFERQQPLAAENFGQLWDCPADISSLCAHTKAFCCASPIWWHSAEQEATTSGAETRRGHFVLVEVTGEIDGNAPHADGNAPYADGNVPYADGNAPYADGNALYADGNAPYADGNAPYGDGNAPYADGNVPDIDENAPYDELLQYVFNIFSILTFFQRTCI